LTIRPPTRWETCRRWLRSQRPAVRWLAGMSAVLLVATAVLGWEYKVQREQAALSQAAAELARDRQAVEAEARARTEIWAKLDQAWFRVRSPQVGRRIGTQQLLREIAAPRRLITDPAEAERIDLEARSLFAASL